MQRIIRVDNSLCVLIKHNIHETPYRPLHVRRGSYCQTKGVRNVEVFFYISLVVSSFKETFECFFHEFVKSIHSSFDLFY